MKEKAKDRSGGISLPQPSSSDLRGRQSVRATFKLTEKAIGTLSLLSAHMGIKQKSLFDHLIEDMEVLGRIAERIRSETFDPPDRIQKTYVLSRRSLAYLDAVSREFGASRDALVDYSIKRLLPLIEQEQERHRQRKDILHELGAYVESGKGLLTRARRVLGEDDPVYGEIENALKVLVETQGHIDTLIEKGNQIEEF